MTHYVSTPTFDAKLHLEGNVIKVVVNDRPPLLVRVDHNYNLTALGSYSLQEWQEALMTLALASSTLKEAANHAASQREGEICESHCEVKIYASYKNRKESCHLLFVPADTFDFPWGLEFVYTFEGPNRWEDAKKKATKIQEYLDEWRRSKS